MTFFRKGKIMRNGDAVTCIEFGSDYYKKKHKPSVDQIRKWVNEGHAQSSSNCKILLEHIDRLNGHIRTLLFENK